MIQPDPELYSRLAGSAWLKAALDARAAVVMFVPPGTWSEGLPMQAEETDDPRPPAEHHMILDRCRLAGRMLGATADVQAEAASRRPNP
ncbi:hypothetical protein OOK44_35335 [Streptomyces cellulosae]|uniref:Uncharacterized protein n=1 Tax=Streptomyces althioticus TaxID=83380 RepID=A0ABZ1YJQ9_9ACTN|nr:hypothetical protein [Streptomyces cellulosae]WTB86450.1 hypothetical protein OG837_34800 [Streptomyces cellulosae]WTB93277.1 hypothetical protein OIE99_34085 [Streptomyces cellulosae]WTC60669.1 hypothetical protein OH715_35840 [Streptomyces cellulosae]